MSIGTPGVWYVCNECNEYFHYPEDDPPKRCSDCKKGILIKTCANCGEEFEDCRCKNKT